MNVFIYQYQILNQRFIIVFKILIGNVERDMEITFSSLHNINVNNFLINWNVSKLITKGKADKKKNIKLCSFFFFLLTS